MATSITSEATGCRSQPKSTTRYTSATSAPAIASVRA